jgi:hypothetical protein
LLSAGAARSQPGRRAAPIVLLHDSLGCVELWRDFPRSSRVPLRAT